jgi:catechol 2,3-dioxygenase-like lactoylglutathione lyase family enzyme
MIDHVTANVGDFEQAKRFYAHRAAHVAFGARDRGMLDAFYEAALAAGGNDNGAPGLRPQYHETYYAAYVHDADGNNVKAVSHVPG